MALQINNASRILLLGNQPCQGGAVEYQYRRKRMRNSIDVVCGLAESLLEIPTTNISSSQCLFIGKESPRKPIPVQPRVVSNYPL
ncbi:hypothetical protein IMZ48_18130 [Candidatus Bathyarchaeota archaeon]|nr:hypothetical protein [Candidatus Bathyarchaeota archaeon]